MRSPASSPTMIGRESDLAVLRDELATVAAGGTRAVVIGGEAGIGKTRLLTEFLDEVEGSATVLLGRCVDLGSDGAPYAPFAAALRRLIELVGVDTVLAAAGPGSAGLSALLPELADDGTLPPRTGAERLYELITVLFENLSVSRPLVLAVDDIHWADTSTLELLRFVVRMSERGRVLVLLGYRSDEVSRGHPLRAYLAELERTRRVTRWELGRLSRDQVAAQLELLLGCVPDAATVDQVNRLSEGVPFFVEELAGIDGLATGDDLPETLRELLLARYERLSAPAQRLLRVVSAGGVCVEHDLLTAVFDGTPEQLDDAAREAVVANVLAADNTEYTFRNALVREAVHADLLPGERTRFHTRYAEALEAAGPQRSAIQLSTHWMAAHDLRRAFTASVEAMEEARRSYAYATVAAMGDRALELWERVPDAEALGGMSRVDLLKRTASALRNGGDSERALALVTAALDDAETLDPVQHARLLRDKAQYVTNLNRPGGIELLREALDVLPAGSTAPGDGLRPQLLAELAARLMLSARFEEAVETASRAIDELGGTGDLRLSVAHNIRGCALVATGRIDEGLAELERARVVAGDDTAALLRHAVNTSDALNGLGRYAEAVAIAEAGAARARARGVERTSGVILSSNTIEPLLALGDLARAEALVDPALALDPPPSFRAHLQHMKLSLMLWRGEVEPADALYRRWRSGLRLQGDLEVQSQLDLAKIGAEIALARGEVDEAWRDAAIVLADGHRVIPAKDLPLLATAARALADRALADRAAADAPGAETRDRLRADAVALETAAAGLRSWPTAPVWTAMITAELATARAVLARLGEAAHPGADASTDRGATDVSAVFAPAVAAWRAAVEVASSPLAPAHVRPLSLFRAARTALAAGDRGSAERLAAEAVAAAETHGYGLIATAAAALTAPRGPRAPAGLSGPGAPLTEREEQVLALIEQGLSNKQIGERLFISAKTASVHVSSILRKVGASSRTEAVYRAGQSVR
ncbi:AAA family ATPase [Leifsonia sp. ZF2019]|uniref:helix-turn-helix transcriptional regulator n=1 Tax=Leifsonia sp. ZF2019 TaxID=2781978 RepID=UPI001CBAB98E|nr:helix-turn-helix transcriptional regulator [Leifsonia sp. ZF2019]UAJ78445.1 AAA family ATPase [Leifsonia sp. ZF2019]